MIAKRCQSRHRSGRQCELPEGHKHSHENSEHSTLGRFYWTDEPAGALKEPRYHDPALSGDAGRQVYDEPIATAQGEQVTIHADTYATLNAMRDLCHKASVDAGWWADLDDVIKYANMSIKNSQRVTSWYYATKLALIHSEASECLEGLRKGLQDDHLPHRTMEEVELADLLIRIFDYAGAGELDIAGAVREKMAYNAQRADHKREARQAVGGKSF